MKMAKPILGPGPGPLRKGDVEGIVLLLRWVADSNINAFFRQETAITT